VLGQPVQAADPATSSDGKSANLSRSTRITFPEIPAGTMIAPVIWKNLKGDRIDL
jgi:hypothetical protein